MIPQSDDGFRFDDGKDAGALRTIGEVTRALGIRQHVLRYWEEQFPQLSPLKRSGGRRYYRPEDIAVIIEIDRLVHREGFTLRGARLFMEAQAGQIQAPAVEGTAPQTPVATQPARMIQELSLIRADLAAALAAS